MKQAEKQLLRFARSIVEETKPSLVFNDEFFNLLRTTSLASAFYAKYRDEIPRDRRTVLRRIWEGQQQLEGEFETILSTLDESPVPVYRMKEWTCRWPHRFAEDVDVAVRKQDLRRFHTFLKNQGFLALPEGPAVKKGSLHTAVKHKQKALPDIASLSNLQQKAYYEFRVFEEGIIALLEDAEQELLRKKDPVFLEAARRRRNIGFGKLPVVIHLIRQRFAEIYGGTSEYQEYEAVIRDVQWLLEKPSACSREERFEQGTVSRDFEYQRGSEYLDVKRLDVTEATTQQPLRTAKNLVEKHDNFILHASHFCKNITLVGDKRLFKGFLKYLIDGAYAFKNQDIRVSDVLHRADQLNRKEEVRFYLYTLDYFGFVQDISIDLPSHYALVPLEGLLFNKESLQMQIASWVIQRVWTLKGKTLNYKA